MPKPASYNQLNDELNKILNDIQSTDLDINDAVAKYERGMEIIKELQTFLKTAENKVKKIKASSEKS